MIEIKHNVNNWVRGCALLLTMLLIASTGAFAQQQMLPVYDKAGGMGCVVVVDSIRLSKGVASPASPTDTVVGLTFMLSLAENALPKTDIVTLTPRLFSETDSVDLPAVRLYGRWAHMALLRGSESTTDASQRLLLPASEAGIPLPYSKHVAYQPWMNEAQLKLIATRSDGCGNAYQHNALTIGETHTVLNQREVFRRTKAPVSHLQGRAYINFAVNKTDIRPDLGNNRRELARLHGVLDSLQQRENTSIQRILLKGYSSPEGPYKHNSELSQGRVESLRQYLVDHYGLAAAIISTDSEPEDWAGLRDYVAKSDLADRQQILAIIDSNDDPDKKLSLIASRHADAYRQLSTVVFPLLRHTDYSIDYSITDGQDTVYTETAVDTIYVKSATIYDEAPVPAMDYAPATFRPWLAVKTNLLYDILVAPNIEVEMPLRRDARWSLMAEYTNPWWRWDKLDDAYEIQEGGVELRHWFSPRCGGSRPFLSGHFVGVYAAVAKFDIEHNKTGDQGDVFSAGLTYGHSWPLARHWNLEASVSAGIVAGERRHYNAEFESTHLIYKYTKNMFYAGPTKLKLSLVYLLGKKGGKR